MIKALRLAAVPAVLLLAFAVRQACAAEISDVFMRAAVSGNTVNVRTAADPKADPAAKASAPMEFIAERLPFTFAGDGSEWCRVLFAYPRGGQGARLRSLHGVPAGRVRLDADDEDLRPLYISTRFIKEKPLAKGDYEAIAGTAWRRRCDAVRAEAFAGARSGHREFAAAVRAFVGIDLPDVLLRWSQGRPLMRGSSSEIYRISRSGGAESEIFIIGGILGTFSGGELVNASIIRRGADVCGIVVGESPEAAITSMLGRPSAVHSGREFSFYTPNSIGAERVIASCARALSYGAGGESLTFGFDDSGKLMLIRTEKGRI